MQGCWCCARARQNKFDIRLLVFFFVISPSIKMLQETGSSDAVVSIPTCIKLQPVEVSWMMWSSPPSMRHC